MHLADDVEEVGVGAFGEGSFFEISELLEEVIFFHVFSNLKGVGSDVGRHET